MSRIIVPVKDKDGNRVYFVTSEHEGKELLSNYDGYKIFLEQGGFRMLKEEEKKSSPQEQPVNRKQQAPKQEQEKPKKFCPQCGEEMRYKEGFSKKTNRPWKAYFCPNDHDPIWL